MKMKAAVLSGVKKFKYMDVDRQEPKDGELLIRIKAVGICGTDMELYYGTMPFFKTGLSKYPLIPGHEWSGVVEKVGKGVASFKPGERVTGDVSIGCGKCINCKRGLYSCCKNRREVGISGGKDGAFAEFIVMPEQFTYKLPEAVSFDAGALTETTATVIKSIRRTPIPLGSVVLVLGAGPIGLMGLQASVVGGAGYSIVAARKDPKLKIAKQLGADRVVNVLKEDLLKVVKEISDGLGVDYCIEASGGIDMMAQASFLVRDGGIINIVGIYPTTIPNYDMSDVVLRDIALIGSVASPNAWEATLKLMGSGRIKTEPCITHRFKLEEIDKAIKVQEEAPPDRLKILLYP